MIEVYKIIQNHVRSYEKHTKSCKNQIKSYENHIKSYKNMIPARGPPIAVFRQAGQAGWAGWKAGRQVLGDTGPRQPPRQAGPEPGALLRYPGETQ